MTFTVLKSIEISLKSAAFIMQCLVSDNLLQGILKHAYTLTMFIHILPTSQSALHCLALTFGLSSPEASLSFSDCELSPIRSEARTRPVL